MTKEFDVIVIGSGPGGYVAAIRAAELGLKTACVEKDPVFGGTCLNQGCIPSKCLLHSSELYFNYSYLGPKQGIQGHITYDFSQMMQRKNHVVQGLRSGILGLFKTHGVHSISGVATFQDSHTIQVGDTPYSAKYFILATGSEPIPLPFMPYDENQILSSTGALSLKKPPQTLLIIGAGVIGIELGSVYARLGTKVTCIESFDRICPNFDAHLSKSLQRILQTQGITFYLSSKVVGLERNPSEVNLILQDNTRVKGEKVLVAVGRRPYTQSLRLETIGIVPDPKGFLIVDDTFRIAPYLHIYAVGDLIAGPMLAHKASDEGYAIAEMIAGNTPPFIESIAIPNVVYTNPEISSVGLTEKEAEERGLPFQVHTHFLKGNGRARCMGEDSGFIKLIIHSPSQVLLGAHILSMHAGDLIGIAIIAIQMRLSIQDIAQICFPHPTLSEAFKEAARMYIAKNNPSSFTKH